MKTRTLLVLLGLFAALWGYLGYWTYSRQAIPMVAMTQPSGTTQLIDTETNAWKIYNGDSFSIKIPSEWTVNKIDDQTYNFKSAYKEVNGIAVGINGIGPNTVVAIGQGHCIYPSADYVLNQQLFDATDYKMLRKSVCISGYQIELDLDADTPTVSQDETILDTILSTFKLVSIPSAVTSSRKTYTNSQLGIEFQYPSDWETPVASDGSISIGHATPEDVEGEKFTIIKQDNKTIDQVIAEIDSQYGVDLSDIQNTELDGMPAKSLNERRQGGFEANGLFIAYSGDIYEIWYGNRELGAPLNEDALQVQTLLSTFKFVK